MCKASESKGSARCQGQSEGRLAQEGQHSRRRQRPRRPERPETVQIPECQATELCFWLASSGLLEFF